MNLRKRMAELLEQGHYTDRPSRIIKLALIFLISLNVIAIALESVSSIYQQYRQAFTYFELFSVAIFTIEYLARVWSCVDFKGAANRSPIIGRIKYMLSPIALIDLIAILPFYLSLYISKDLRFLRVLRMLRLLKTHALLSGTRCFAGCYPERIPGINGSFRGAFNHAHYLGQWHLPPRK